MFKLQLAFKDLIYLLWTEFWNPKHFRNFTLLFSIVEWLLCHMTTTVTWHKLEEHERDLMWPYWSCDVVAIQPWLTKTVWNYWNVYCFKIRFSEGKSNFCKMNPEPSKRHTWIQLTCSVYQHCVTLIFVQTQNLVASKMTASDYVKMKQLMFFYGAHLILNQHRLQGSMYDVSDHSYGQMSFGTMWFWVHEQF